MGKHSNLIKKAFEYPWKDGAGSPWLKWRNLNAPEPKLTSSDLEGAPLSGPSSSAGGSSLGAGAAQGDLESLVDEFLASRGGGSTAASSGSGTSAGATSSNPQNFHIIPRMYPYTPRKPKNISIDVEGNISSKDLNRILKRVTKMAREPRHSMPYGMMPMIPYGMVPMMPYGMMPAQQQQQEQPQKRDEVPTAAASSANPDPASTIRDFIAFAKARGVDLSGASPAVLASAVDTDSDKSKDSKKKYSESDLQKKKDEIDAAADIAEQLPARYGAAIDKAMDAHRTNKARWDRYRRWSPAISAASTIGGGILADKLYNKYILKGMDPSVQSSNEWWQRFWAARAGNVGGYVLSMLPNMLLKPRHDMSTHAYPTPSDIK